MTFQQFNKSYQIDNDVIEIRAPSDSAFYSNVYPDRKTDQSRQNMSSTNEFYDHTSHHRPPSYNNSINRANSDSAKYTHTLNYQNYPMYNNTDYYSKYAGYEFKHEQRPNDYYYSYYQTPKEQLQNNYVYDYQHYSKFRSANYELNNNQLYNCGINEPNNFRQQVYASQQVYTDNSNFKPNDFISYNNVGYLNNFTDPNVFLNGCMSSSSSSSSSESSYNSSLLISGEIVMPDELVDERCVSELGSEEASRKSGEMSVGGSKKNLNELLENGESEEEATRPKCKKLRSINEDELNESDSEKLPVVNCYFSLADCDENENPNPIDLLMQDVQKQQLELNF